MFPSALRVPGNDTIPGIMISPIGEGDQKSWDSSLEVKDDGKVSPFQGDDATQGDKDSKAESK